MDGVEPIRRIAAPEARQFRRDDLEALRKARECRGPAPAAAGAVQPEQGRTFAATLKEGAAACDGNELFLHAGRIPVSAITACQVARSAASMAASSSAEPPTGSKPRPRSRAPKSGAAIAWRVARSITVAMTGGVPM